MSSSYTKGDSRTGESLATRRAHAGPSFVLEKLSCGPRNLQARSPGCRAWSIRSIQGDGLRIVMEKAEAAYPTARSWLSTERRSRLRRGWKTRSSAFSSSRTPHHPIPLPPQGNSAGRCRRRRGEGSLPLFRRLRCGKGCQFLRAQGRDIRAARSQRRRKVHNVPDALRPASTPHRER